MTASRKPAAAYRAPAAVASAEIVVLRSRFIAIASRADSVAEARQQIEQARAQWPAASHHVYAFRIGHGASVTEGKSDDGEPRGTAGAPILAILRGSGLGDILLVVTRYFGGRKLGTGGLVRAYGDAARAALAKLPLEERVERSQLLLKVPYPFLAAARRQISAFNAQETDCRYGEQAELRALVAVSRRAAFCDAIAEISGGGVVIQINGE